MQTDCFYHLLLIEIKISVENIAVPKRITANIPIIIALTK